MRMVDAGATKNIRNQVIIINHVPSILEIAWKHGNLNQLNTFYGGKETPTPRLINFKGNRSPYQRVLISRCHVCQSQKRPPERP